jgi:hypothetical protein
MKYVIRTEQSIQIDPEDFDFVQSIKWHISNAGYAVNRQKGLLHRLLMNPPKDKVVDHINGDKLDNRRSNLRVIDQAENVTNSKKTWGRSKHKGVWFSKEKNKWAATIACRKVRTHLGYFKTEKEAAEAYRIAAMERAYRT